MASFDVSLDEPIQKNKNKSNLDTNKRNRNIQQRIFRPANIGPKTLNFRYKKISLS